MILILGGTSEASGLARLVAAQPGRRAMLSFAGRTSNPVPPPIPLRIGGFGGPEKLAAFLSAEGVIGVIDATHPFAEAISANAGIACRATGTPLLVLRRPPWQAREGDRWREVEDGAEAAAALGIERRRVFLTVGRLELEPFLAVPQHRYLIRCVEPPERLPPDARLILARGPFEEAAETALIEDEGIEVVVTKNSGGAATYGKIAAARRLGLPVILIRPPAPVLAETVETPEAALAWIEALPAHDEAVPRGV